MLLLLLLFYSFYCDNTISIDVIYLCCTSVSICAAVSSIMHHHSAVPRYITVNISMFQAVRWDQHFMCNACLLIFISVFVTCVPSICVWSIECVGHCLLVHGSCEAVQCYTGIGEPAIVRLQDVRAVNCSTVDGVLLWCICVYQRSLYTI